jgi:hypothetical protein
MDNLMNIIMKFFCSIKDGIYWVSGQPIGSQWLYVALRSQWVIQLSEKKLSFLSQL